MNAEPPVRRVFVIDDDSAVRVSTLSLLGGLGYEAEGFDAAEPFLAHARAATAAAAPLSGCALLDYRMPGLDGLAALPLLAEHCPALRVVMITAHGDVDVAVRAMKLGAVDFLEKPWNKTALIAAVDGALADAAVHAAAAEARAAARAKLDALTPRERDVMDALITGAPNKIIAHDLGLSPRTVEFHRARVLRKTGVASVAELVTLKAAAEA